MSYLNIPLVDVGVIFSSIIKLHCILSLSDDGTFSSSNKSQDSRNNALSAVKRILNITLIYKTCVFLIS